MKVYVAVYPDHECSVFTNLKDLAAHITAWDEPFLSNDKPPTEENLSEWMRNLGVAYIYKGSTQNWWMKISKLEI
jgi:hypothetical protein